MLSVVPERQGGVTPAQLKEMMAASQYWPPEKMLAYQRLQLTQLLVHARNTTAFYKDRLSPVFERDGNVDLSKWRYLPILTRKDLQKHRDEMRSNAIPKNHGHIETNSSSGSTGQPIQVDITALAFEVSKSAWERFFHWHGVDVERGFTQIKAYTPDGKLMTKHVLVEVSKQHAIRKIFIRRNLSTKQKLAYLRSTNSANLNDFSNHAELLARENLRAKKPIRLSHFVGIGMKITPQQELLFNESFHAKTLSPYSSEESMLMACQCAETRGNFHICSELNFVEVLDDNGDEVAVGQPGRIVTTPLFSSAQPLIRYEQGDIVVRGPPCQCGRSMPVLSEIRGRKDAIFQFPGKQVSMNKFDEDLVQKALSADAFQFAQVSPHLILVRYVSEKIAGPSNQDIVRAHLLDMLRTKVEIDFNRVEEIPTNAGGKQQRITREF